MTSVSSCIIGTKLCGRASELHVTREMHTNFTSLGLLTCNLAKKK